MDFSKELMLNLKSDSYIVIGSGIMDALGLREAKDIDLVVDSETYRLFKQQGWVEKTHDDTTTELNSGIFGMSTSWDSPNASDNLEELLTDSIKIDGVSYVSPQRLLNWKIRKNRPKDQKDIAMLKNYLAINNG